MESLSHAQSKWCTLIRPSKKQAHKHSSLLETLFWVGIGFIIDTAVMLFMAFVDYTKPRSRKPKVNDDERTGFFESVAGAALLTFGLMRWSIEAFASIIFDYPIPEFEEQYQFKKRDWIGL